jgi:hypothetical protein
MVVYPRCFHPAINFTNSTPSDGSTVNSNTITVGINSSDANNISTFVDFDNSLVSWWRMDDLNSSGGVIDYMGRNNGTNVGGVSQVSNGKMGKAMSFDGNDDYVGTTC